MKIDTFLTVALTAGDYTKEHLLKLGNYLTEHFFNYEILLLKANPLLDLNDILSVFPCIRYLSVSAALSKENISRIVVDNCIGDYLVFFDPAADPLETLPELVRLAQNGAEIVIGTANYPQTLLYRFSRLLGTQLLKSINYKIQPNTTDLICLTRNAINTLFRTGKGYKQFLLDISGLGLPIAYHAYTLLDKSHYKKHFRDGLIKAFDIIIFSSTKPLRWISALGFAASGIACLFALYVFAINIFKSTVEGWTSTILIVSFLFMLLFIILAFLGEYLSRLLDEQASKEIYSVFTEKCSRVMLEKDRLNVLTESELKND
jgi:hypothetical protein